MTTEEARLQRALRDAEADRDSERRRAEVAESKARGLAEELRLLGETQAAIDDEAERTGPREREPAVWAAAYGAAFVAAYLDAVSAADGQGDARTEAALADVHVARCRRIADAAVLSLEASR